MSTKPQSIILKIDDEYELFVSCNSLNEWRWSIYYLNQESPQYWSLGVFNDDAEAFDHAMGKIEQMQLV